MEQFKIIDDVFSNEDVLLINKYFKENNWKCLCIKDDNVIRAYNMKNELDRPYWRLELIDDDFFNNYLKKLIEYKLIEYKLNENYITERIYAVSQTNQQNSNYHVDNNKKDDFTFCYYINDDYEKIDEGFFYIKIPNKKHIVCIEPENNRGIIFPSNIVHKGSSFNNNNIRICITWKFKKMRKK